jgi:heme o synthase
MPADTITEHSGPVAAGGLGQRVLDYLELTKLRLSSLVLFTVGAGYLLGAAGTEASWLRGGLTLLGTMLAALGANALNQWWELRWDSVMERTRDRPLPAGRITPGEALAVASGLLVGGSALLAVWVDARVALLTLMCGLVYVLVYTPLKRRTPLSLIPGALVGAVPPVLGWLAASGRLGVEAAVLFGILFLWQVPHFLAIDWYHRDDYSRGGYRTLSAWDPSGKSTAVVSLLGSILLFGVALAAIPVGLGGPFYAAAAGVINLVFLAATVRFVRRRARDTARGLFLISLAYLPLLFVPMVLEAGR